jgi:outer membrane protein OmpA-like peptidoglycan-associated protein
MSDKGAPASAPQKADAPKSPAGDRGIKGNIQPKAVEQSATARVKKGGGKPTGRRDISGPEKTRKDNMNNGQEAGSDATTNEGKKAQKGRDEMTSPASVYRRGSRYRPPGRFANKNLQRIREGHRHKSERNETSKDTGPKNEPVKHQANAREEATFEEDARATIAAAGPGGERGPSAAGDAQSEQDTDAQPSDTGIRNRRARKRERPDPTGGPADGDRGRRTRLSEGQRIERNTMAELNDGLGFAFGSARIERAQARRFDGYMRQTLEEAKRSGQEIVITASASRPGAEGANQALAAQRGENMKNFLIEEYGIPEDQITVRIIGEINEGIELPGSDDQDNAYHRFARIEVRSNPSESTSEGGDAKKTSASTGSREGSIPEIGLKSPPQDALGQRIAQKLLELAGETAVNIHNADAGKIGDYGNAFLGALAAVGGVLAMFDSDKDGFERVQGGITAVEGTSSAVEGVAEIAGAAETVALAGAVSTVFTTLGLVANAFYGLGIGTREAMEDAVNRRLPHGYATGLAARILGYKLSDVKSAFSYLEQSDHDGRPMQRMVRAVGMQAELDGLLKGYEAAGRMPPEQQTALRSYLLRNLRNNELIDLASARSTHGQLNAYSGPIYRLLTQRPKSGD